MLSDKRYQQLKSRSFEVLDNEYKEKLLGINEWREYAVDKKLIKGKIKGCG